ncbi:substrate-binding domain-containing protein [Pectobacterium betavasculorum]|uniref:substrate-binding domain-containing protein n=1 Tax=Pectobacterium betavasculorum TaxID=55207 RepID=UPI003CC7AFB0
MLKKHYCFSGQQPMHSTSQPSTLFVGIAPDVSRVRLARLLAVIRAHDPHIRLRIHQAPPEKLFDELEAGQCDLAFAPAPAPAQRPTLESNRLWREELALAHPLRSRLLAYSTIPSESLQKYSMIQWCPTEHRALHRHVATLVGRSAITTYTVVSFEMMIALVAAGLGIGIAQRSQLDHVCAWPVEVRSLSGQGHCLDTELFWRRGQRPQFHERLLAAAALPDLMAKRS